MQKEKKEKEKKEKEKKDKKDKKGSKESIDSSYMDVNPNKGHGTAQMYMDAPGGKWGRWLCVMNGEIINEKIVFCFFFSIKIIKLFPNKSETIVPK